MAAPDIYDPANKASLTELLQQQGNISAELQQQEMEWMELAEQLQKLEAE